MPSQQHPNSDNSSGNQGEKQSTTTRRHRNRYSRARANLSRRPGREQQRMLLSSSVSASTSSSTPSVAPADYSSASTSPLSLQSGNPTSHHQPTTNAQSSNQPTPASPPQQPSPSAAATATLTTTTPTPTTTENATTEDTTSDEYKLLLSPMFAAMTRITDHVFLTGVGGMTRANFRRNHIDFVVNITTEAPFWENTQSMRLPLEDDVSTNILPYLDTAVNHIQEAIVKRNAHVLVHCIAGVSRSATVVIAYLMKYKRMDLRTAFNYCYNLRPVIRPNNGFMQQLIAYEQQLFGRNTVWMSEAEVDGVQVRVPHFFIEEHPRLLVLEMMRVKAISRVTSGGSGITANAASQQPPSPPSPPPPSGASNTNPTTRPPPPPPPPSADER